MRKRIRKFHRSTRKRRTPGTSIPLIVTDGEGILERWKLIAHAVKDCWSLQELRTMRRRADDERGDHSPQVEACQLQSHGYRVLRPIPTRRFAVIGPVRHRLCRGVSLTRNQTPSPLARAGALGGLLFADSVRYACQGLCRPWTRTRASPPLTALPRLATCRWPAQLPALESDG